MIIVDTVAHWIMSDSEPVQMTDTGAVLCGPAASADDADVWDGSGLGL